MTETTLKKISADQFSWYVFFICGVIIPGVANAVLNLIGKGFSISIENDVIKLILNVLFDILVLWFGIKYYLSYAQKKYELSNKKKLVNNIVITFIAWTVLGFIIMYFGLKSADVEFIVPVILSIIQVVVVYVALKRYVVIR